MFFLDDDEYENFTDAQSFLKQLTFESAKFACEIIYHLCLPVSMTIQILGKKSTLVR